MKKKILVLVTGVAVCVLANAGTKPETASREKLRVGVYADVGARGSVLAYSRLAALSPDCEAKFIDGASVRAGALSGVVSHLQPFSVMVILRTRTYILRL
jgi:hypothetical protein